MDKKFIFIQVPDDTTPVEGRSLMEGLRSLKLPYNFVVVPVSYKAMSADEVRHLLDGLLAAV